VRLPSRLETSSAQSNRSIANGRKQRHLQWDSSTPNQSKTKHKTIQAPAPSIKQTLGQEHTLRKRMCQFTLLARMSLVRLLPSRHFELSGQFGMQVCKNQESLHCLPSRHLDNPTSHELTTSSRRKHLDTIIKADSKTSIARNNQHRICVAFLIQ